MRSVATVSIVYMIATKEKLTGADHPLPHLIDRPHGILGSGTWHFSRIPSSKKDASEVLRAGEPIGSQLRG